MRIVEDAPFRTELEQLETSQQVNGRALVARRLNRVSRKSGCRVLHMGETAEQSPAEIVRSVRGVPCGTIFDDDTAADSVIQFQVRDRRVRFWAGADRSERQIKQTTRT